MEINDQDLKDLKKLFNATKKAALIHRNTGAELDRKIDQVFGFHPSETDDDGIIDSLDYATDSISFESFIRKMNGYNTQRNSFGFTGYKPEF